MPLQEFRRIIGLRDNVKRERVNVINFSDTKTRQAPPSNYQRFTETQQKFQNDYRTNPSVRPFEQQQFQPHSQLNFTPTKPLNGIQSFPGQSNSYFNFPSSEQPYNQIPISSSRQMMHSLANTGFQYEQHPINPCVPRLGMAEASQYSMPDINNNYNGLPNNNSSYSVFTNPSMVPVLNEELK